MTHLDPWRRTTTRELRSFGLLVGGAFGALAAILSWRTGHLSVLVSVFAVTGGLLALTGTAVPAVLAPVYAGWMRFAILLSRITTPIFMGVIYFAVLTPIGVLMRTFGRNPLRSGTAESFWVSRSADGGASVLQRQF